MVKPICRPLSGWANRGLSGVQDVSILTVCFNETDYGVPSGVTIPFPISPLAFIGIDLTHVSSLAHRSHAAQWLSFACAKSFVLSR